MPSAADTGVRPRLPGWLEAPAIGLVAGVAALGLSSLVLAIAGRFEPAWVLPIGLPVALLFAVVAGRARPRGGRVGLPGHSAAVAGLALIVALTVWNGAHRGEHLITERDPGVYALTGQWLARDGDLDVEAAVGPYADDVAVDVAASQGFFVDERGDPTLSPQFLHLQPALLGIGHWAGGDTWLFVLPAVMGALGLLTVLLIAGRYVHPWLAVAATAAVGLSLPQVHFSRDTFSEPLTQAFLIGAVVLLGWAIDGHRPAAGALAGVMLGAAFATRIDVLVVLAAVPVWLALRWIADRRVTPVALAVLAGLAGGCGVAAADLRFRSRPYFELHRSETMSQVALLVAAFVLAVLLLVIVPRAGRLRRFVAAHRGGIGAIVAVAIVVFAAFAWFVRPELETATEVPSSTVSLYQRLEGKPDEPSRRYYEESLVWHAWYLGPAGLAAGIAGVAAAAGIAVAGRGRRHDAALTLVVGVFLAPSVLYLWRARAFPDHMWVMRRFLPVTLPGFAIGAVAVAGALLAGRAGRPRRWERVPMAVAGIALVAAIVAAPIEATWPAREAQSQDGLLAATRALCAYGGDDAAWLVLTEGNYDQLLTQTMRSACGAPSAGARRGIAKEDVDRLAAAWRAEGRRLIVLGATPGFVQPLVGDAPVETSLSPAVHELERTLTRRPEHLFPNPLTFAYAAAG